MGWRLQVRGTGLEKFPCSFNILCVLRMDVNIYTPPRVHL